MWCLSPMHCLFHWTSSSFSSSIFSWIIGFTHFEQRYRVLCSLCTTFSVCMHEMMDTEVFSILWLHAEYFTKDPNAAVSSAGLFDSSFGCTAVQGLLITLFLIFVQSHRISPMVYVLKYSSTNNMQSPLFSTSFLSLTYCLYDNSHSIGVRWYPFVAWLFISMMM